MEYVFVAEGDGDSLSGFFPDVPGCITVGRDMQELLSNAKEALELHLHDEEFLPTARALAEVAADPELREEPDTVVGLFRVKFERLFSPEDVRVAEPVSPVS